jgi:hypothetical protein
VVRYAFRAWDLVVNPSSPFLSLESFENVDEGEFVLGRVSRGNIKRRKHAFTGGRGAFEVH